MIEERRYSDEIRRKKYENIDVVYIENCYNDVYNNIQALESGDPGS